ncbi:STAS domain-containing protein [Alteromonas oceanisediminis]|uniref:STAS domain-containing protein n=1 Tax=Alteromonas oceanisediminis TaxID=2836180 RepID=UPI001BD939EF|nr:STAS domain-containing protein [Alteromonas oceanisediminis]MBT0587545.1 STAS domain-containing protein [Alteromonas oceanisediminis]
MALETQLSTDEKLLVIKMDDKFDFGKVQDFRKAYADLPESVNVVEVDLAHTEYMDSSALGMLLNMQKVLKDSVPTIRITHCRPQVLKILTISRFDKKFDIK